MLGIERKREEVMRVGARLESCLVACWLIACLRSGLDTGLRGLLVKWRGLGPVWTVFLARCRNWGNLMGSE